MAEKILMTALSPTMEEGTIFKWTKKEGDKVGENDVICEIETDKATMDLECPNEGILLKIIRKDGEKAKVGETIGIIGAKGENIDSILKELESQDKRESEKPQEKIKIEEAAEPIKKIEEKLEVEKPIIVQNTVEDEDSKRIKASPLARKIAAINNVNLNNIKGSGPNGRIVKADIEEWLSKPHLASVKKGELGGSLASHTLVEKVINVSAKRKIIAERLKESKNNAPHFYLQLSIAIDKLMDFRKEMTSLTNKKISFNAYLIKLVAEAIKKHPIINSSWQETTIKYHSSVNIALAVAQEDGLVTPVINSCDVKSIVQIEDELKELIEKARSGKLSPQEYTGQTFTISNLGSFGIERFTAIINPPNVAILALGKAEKRTIVNNEGEIEIKTMMEASLSCDHRAIDGAVGAAFLKHLKDIIENPFKLIY